MKFDTILLVAGLAAVLAAELQRRIMVIDGAMGTMIQTFGLQEEDFKGCVTNIIIL